MKQNYIYRSITSSALVLGVALTQINSNSTRLVPYFNDLIPSVRKDICYQYDNDTTLASLKPLASYGVIGFERYKEGLLEVTVYETDTFMPSIDNAFETNEFAFGITEESMHVIKPEQETKWAPNSKVELEAYKLFGEMRDATEEERASVYGYIRSISVDTGVNFFDLC